MSRARLLGSTASPYAKKELGEMTKVPTEKVRVRWATLATAMTGLAMLLLIGWYPPVASADFGISKFDVTFTDKDGAASTQAGSHPFAVTTTFELNNSVSAVDGEVKDLEFELPAGFVGDLTAMPRCSTSDFVTRIPGEFSEIECSDNTAIGVASTNVSAPFIFVPSAIYNVEPPPGVPARVGFNVIGVPVLVDVTVKDRPPYNVTSAVRNAPQPLPVFGAQAVLWGDPGHSAHDSIRGHCLATEALGINEPNYSSDGVCPISGVDKPLLTLPGSCTGPVEIPYLAVPWSDPDTSVTGSVITHDDATPPNPQGFTGCGKLSFLPTTESAATADSAETGSGFEFSVEFDDEGLINSDGLAQSQTQKAEVILPEGMTVNPSVGEGLGVCTPAALERETLGSEPGEGCPNASKVGNLHVETPIADEPIDGSIFLAQQDDPATVVPGAENPFDSLIALYFVLKNTNLGLIVKLPALVEPDPVTGRLAVTLDDIPQFPFSHFSARLREGQRAALVTPATCGSHRTEARLYPWSNPDNPRTVNSSFEIVEGVNGGPCPPGGVPPFQPGFQAGSINNNAGSFSPFNMRLVRNDGEQNMTKFSSVLPPGVLGSLAGVAKCPDVAVDVAKAKTGRQELAAPSCPVSSQIGRTLAGAGVGSALTYVGGQVYLAGPYKGAPLSVIAITPAVAGPFDAGTVVVRLGLDLDPKTAEVSVDGAASDPIPHILKGIVLKVRDLRVYVDRPNFTLNPTSCDPSSAKAQLFGSFLDVLNPADDVPVDLATRYQAANCLNLGFGPKLGLRLKGGTKRGGHPGLRAVYTPKRGDANIEGLVVRLPRSAFLDQAHIRTICTRVQFAAESCPKAAQYGYIRAWTPLLDTPLQGPVWLRSSNHKLPDLVFDLKGLVDIEVAVRIDSARGGIRATLVDAPDAPLSRVVLNMQGGKKGLIINSRNLCTRKSRANVRGTGHNGKRHNANPVMRPQCKRRKAKRSSHGRAPRSSVASSSAVG